MDQVVCVELDAAGPGLALDLRAALEAFAEIYHRAGLDVIEA